MGGVSSENEKATKFQKIMKRINNVYESIATIENVKLAIHKASRGKKNRRNVRNILCNEDYYANQILIMLQSKSYVPSPYIEMKLYDGANKKERIISKPRFYPDQIIHWCLMLQLEPILKRKMYYWSCASIKGRGQKHGAKLVERALRNKKKSKYCLKLDVSKFYQSVNNEILKNQFRHLLKDKDTLWLIETIIDSAKGLPIGNYTSQWFANIYLTNLDLFICNTKATYYVRYMDDMVIFCSNKTALWNIKYQIENYLHNNLDLKIKGNWQLFLVDSRPVDFLGYKFYRKYKVLRRGTFLRIKRRIKKMYKKGKYTLKDCRAVMSYYGWLKHSNSIGFQIKYIEPFIDLEICKGVISNESKIRNKANISI